MCFSSFLVALPFCCVCVVSDFSHVAAILQSSGVISEQQATQPHGQRAQRQSERLPESEVGAGSTLSAVANGTTDITAQQPLSSVAAFPRVPPAAAATVGAVHASVLPVSSTASSSSSLSDSAYPVLRCGVIGSGRSASRLISQLSLTRGCRVVSVLSKNNSRSAALRKQHPAVASVQSDLAAFLSHSDVDAVFIASAVGSAKYGSHHTLALACAESGKPTVVDRPFARSASEAREMQTAFERAQVPLLVHQPLRATPAITSLQQSIAALQRVTSISYSFSAPLSALTAASSSSSVLSSSASLPCLPRSVASNGGPLLTLVCDLFDVLECVLGAVSHVTGDAVHCPPSTSFPSHSSSSSSSSVPSAAASAVSADSISSSPSAQCEAVVSCSFRCGGALGSAVWDVASSSHDDRLVLRGTGGDLTLSLYQPTMPILQTAAGIQQVSAPQHSASASAAASSSSSSSSPPAADTGSSGEAVQRLVDQLRRQSAARSNQAAGAHRDRAAPAATDGSGSGSGSDGSKGGSGSGSSTSSSGNDSDSAAVDVCLVTAAMAVRSLACADAALRSFYRLRTDAYWDRPHTWQSHQWTVPTLPK